MSVTLISSSSIVNDMLTIDIVTCITDQMILYSWSTGSQSQSRSRSLTHTHSHGKIVSCKQSTIYCHPACCFDKRQGLNWDSTLDECQAYPTRLWQSEFVYIWSYMRLNFGFYILKVKLDHCFFNSNLLVDRTVLRSKKPLFTH